MKNYDETINSVFNRIDEYNSLQKKRKQNVIKFTAALSCACLAVLAGVTIWHGATSEDTPEQTIDDALYPGLDDLIDDNTSASTDKATSNTGSSNKIVINRLDTISNSKMDISLMWDDFVVMNATELNEYYGVNVFPSVPSDLKGHLDQQYGIFKRDNGTGELYHDVNDLCYSNEDYSRSVNVEVSKGKLPFSCVIICDEKAEPSIINGTEVNIASPSDKFYYVEFMYNDVGFRIVTDGLSEDEMVEVVDSIIK